MDLLWCLNFLLYHFLFSVAVLSVFVIIILLLDCDLVLAYYCRFGKEPSSGKARSVETSLDVQRSLLEINTLDAISLSQAVVKQMQVQKDGLIVVVSSIIAGKLGKSQQSLQNNIPYSYKFSRDVNFAVSQINVGSRKLSCRKFIFYTSAHIIYQYDPRK